MDDESDRVSMCAGALIFMRNSCKSAQHPDYGDALQQVEPDPENVFCWPQEFRDYHADREGWVKKAVERMQQRQSEIISQEEDDRAKG